MRYQEVVIEGPRGWGLGFLQGYMRGHGHDDLVIDAEEEGFDCESFREQLREVLLPTEEILHLVAPNRLVPRIRKAVREAAGMGRRIAVKHARPLAGARFAFNFSIFSRPHAMRVRRLFDRLERGVHLTDGTRFEEIKNPDARGLEMYAPIHHYEMHGEGGVTGDLEGVLPLFRACRDEELVQVTRAELIGITTKRAGRKKRR